MLIEVASKKHRGPRQKQQDAVHASKVHTLSGDVQWADIGAFDGASCHQNSEIASSHAADSLPRLLAGHIHDRKSIQPNEVANALVQAVEKTNDQIVEMGNQNPALQGLATTCVYCVILPRICIVVGAGDSAAFLIRQSKARRLLPPHTVTRELYDEGLLSEDRYAQHVQRHVLRRYLGCAQGFSCQVAVCSVEDGDQIVVATDGVTNVLGVDDISRIAFNATNAQAVANQIVEASLDGGTRDNVAVACARYSSVLGESPQFETITESYFDTLRQCSRNAKGELQ